MIKQGQLFYGKYTEGSGGGGGGSDSFKEYFGENIYHFMDDLDSDGLIPFFKTAEKEMTISAKDIPPYWGGSNKFENSDIETLIINIPKVNGFGALNNFMGNNKKIKNTTLNIKKLSSNAAVGIHTENTSLENADVSKIEEMGYNSMTNAFSNTKIKTLRFTNLKKIARRGMTQICIKCAELESIYFNSLDEDSFLSNDIGTIFDGITASISGEVVVHFPSNVETTVQGLNGYPNFGGTSGRITLAFDLPATN